jgi:hypothetical protein
LVRGDKSASTLEAARNSPWISVSSGRHWRDDNRAQVIVQFIWRHDKTWSCLTNFATPRRIEPHQVNITSGWHGRFLSPFPIFLVEPGRSRGIKETVFTSLMHLTSCGSPSRTRSASPANHNPTWLSVKFNFISKLSLFQKYLWQAYTPGIANLNNATFHVNPLDLHCSHTAAELAIKMTG